ncbi:MAG: translation initiation factor IF-2 [Dysgonamonadaceae bacterium]|nr:translation initiation factor IF-2 [Dysgonamonadaceae bacterium]MDD4727588.1 translation initiation factor IF-2 [Dysgonamonadaceae bacterium]
MSIRLIKVSKELNVGVSSLVEFLHKKGVEVEASPNAKINNEHRDMLLIEFGKDKNMKKTVDRQREEQLNKEKKETVAIEGYDVPDKEQIKGEEKDSSTETNVPEDIKPQFKIVGNIDLDNLKNKPKKSTKPQEVEEKQEPVTPELQDVEPEEVKEFEKPEKEVPVEKVEEEKIKEEEEIKIDIETSKQTPSAPLVKAEDESTILDDKKEDESKETALEDIKADITVDIQEKTVEDEKPVEKEQTQVVEKTEKTVAKSDKAKNKKKSKEVIEDSEIPEKEVPVLEDFKDDEEEDEKEDDLFRLNDTKIKTNIVVKGSIDLTSINERTRPARKSRTQRKKERLEREGKASSQRVKEENIKALKKETLNEKKSPDADDSTKKKRKRIRKGKVNIERTEATAPKSVSKRRLVLKKPVKKEVSEEDVQKQIKETLARLTQRRGGGKGGARHRRDKRDAIVQRQQAEIKEQERESRILQLTEFVTANDLANMMDVPVTDVISTCMSIGVMVAINQRLDAETINIVADEFGFKTKYVSADVVEAIAQEDDDEKDLIPRSPIVTVMGHVDHGKTSLLDSIRDTNVIAGEAGGITQHIGAYHVTLKSGKKITFLDTPGHEAFTAMRARGAKVTDVAIIIVAADDNVMPQTIEAINHASAAGVPIVFAINKIDKSGANPEKVKEELANMNYLVEDWGGKYQSHDISAKQGIGVPELLEKIQLEAEMLDLKANPNRSGFGSVIESSLDKGRGYVSTILVQNGTLKVGDVVLAGAYFGRIKAMFNERNKNIDKAGPAEPALILGLNGAPQAGDIFHVIESEQEARSIANKREQLQREQSIRTQKILTLDDIGRRIAVGNFQELNIIVKGDVDGSVEALSDSLIRLSTPEIQVNVIHKAVGQISESDITLASASEGIIIGFQVRPSLTARKEAEQQGIDIRLYSVIYDAIEEVRAAMEGMLSPEIKEEITANIEVLETFKITKVGTIAGCMVRDGKVKRSNKIRLIRDGIVVYSGELESLKRFKEDVREVSAGYECGLNIRNFNDIKVGDIVEAYEEVEVRKTL